MTNHTDQQIPEGCIRAADELAKSPKIITLLAAAASPFQSDVDQARDEIARLIAQHTGAGEMVESLRDAYPFVVAWQGMNSEPTYGNPKAAQNASEARRKIEVTLTGIGEHVIRKHALTAAGERGNEQEDSDGK